LLVLHYLRFDPAIMAGSHIVTTGTKQPMRAAGTNMWPLQDISPDFALYRTEQRNLLDFL